MRLIWATRGRTWGFRFLLDGDFDDPLLVRDRAFADAASQPEYLRRARDTVALRFPDPMHRLDASGRTIPHEFVIVWPRPWAVPIDSVADGRRLIWPLVADEFERIWDLAEPPR